jgi:glycosidase
MTSPIIGASIRRSERWTISMRFSKPRMQGLRVILDLVPNHTSDQHLWFKESRSSRESLKRDWYIWRDAAAGGGPPNNWLSEFGGSA